MGLLLPEAWPAWVAVFILVLAAVINVRTLKVPNWLTHGGVLSGLAVGLLANAGVVNLSGGIGASVVAAAVGFGLLIPWVPRGWLGEGCVKAQMAFGAWLGGAAGWESAALVALAAGLGGMAALILVSGVLIRVGGTNPRNSWGLRFPAQLPLSIGSSVGMLGWYLS